MPSAEVVIWAATCGLIVLMIALIAYLLRFGFERILTEIQGLRADIKQIDAERAEMKLWQREMETRCHMIHGIDPTPCKLQHPS